jgi:hypothetical protein
VAITTVDGLIAGTQPPRHFLKTGITMAAVAAQRGYTPWYANGTVGPGTASSAGTGGEALTGPINGQIPRSNPGSGNAYLKRFCAGGSVVGVMWLIDRLWQNSGLSVTSTSPQGITAATLPARDIAGSTNGDGVMAAIEWSATGGAGTPTVTLTYDDQSGNPSATGTFTGVTTPPVGTFEIFTLAGGDTGIREPTSFVQSATRTSGTMHLVLFRVLAQIECSVANVATAVDFLSNGVRLYDGTVPQIVWFPSATTATSMFGEYSETHG